MAFLHSTSASVQCVSVKKIVLRGSSNFPTVWLARTDAKYSRSHSVFRQITTLFSPDMLMQIFRIVLDQGLSLPLTFPWLSGILARDSLLSHDSINSTPGYDVHMYLYVCMYVCIIYNTLIFRFFAYLLCTVHICILRSIFNLSCQKVHTLDSSFCVVNFYLRNE